MPGPLAKRPSVSPCPTLRRNPNGREDTRSPRARLPQVEPFFAGFLKSGAGPADGPVGRRRSEQARRGRDGPRPTAAARGAGARGLASAGERDVPVVALAGEDVARVVLEHRGPVAALADVLEVGLDVIGDVDAGRDVHLVAVPVALG